MTIAETSAAGKECHVALPDDKTVWLTLINGVDGDDGDDTPHRIRFALDGAALYMLSEQINMAKGALRNRP